MRTVRQSEILCPPSPLNQKQIKPLEVYIQDFKSTTSRDSKIIINSGMKTENLILPEM